MRINGQEAKEVDQEPLEIEKTLRKQNRAEKMRNRDGNMLQYIFSKSLSDIDRRSPKFRVI